MRLQTDMEVTARTCQHLRVMGLELHPPVTKETMRKWQQIRFVLTKKVGIFEDVQLLVELFRR